MILFFVWLRFGKAYPQPLGTSCRSKSTGEAMQTQHSLQRAGQTALGFIVSMVSDIGNVFFLCSDAPPHALLQVRLFILVCVGPRVYNFQDTEWQCLLSLRPIVGQALPGPFAFGFLMCQNRNRCNIQADKGQQSNLPGPKDIWRHATCKSIPNNAGWTRGSSKFIASSDVPKESLNDSLNCFFGTDLLVQRMWGEPGSGSSFGWSFCDLYKRGCFWAVQRSLRRIRCFQSSGRRGTQTTMPQRSLDQKSLSLFQSEQVGKHYDLENCRKYHDTWQQIRKANRNVTLKSARATVDPFMQATCASASSTAHKKIWFQ